MTSNSIPTFEPAPRQARSAAHHAPAAYSRLLVRLALCLSMLAPTAGAMQNDLDKRVGKLLAAQVESVDAKADGLRLASLGTSALPALFDCLRDGAFWVSVEDGFETRSLSVAQTDSLLNALSRIQAADIRTFLRARTTEAPTPENRRTALRLMANIARANDLAFCMQLAQPLTPETPVDSLAADHLQRCLEKMLSESESVFHGMRTVFERAHLDLRPTIIRAVTTVGTDAGLRALSQFLSLTDHLQSFVLSSMGRVATTVTLPVDELIALRIRQMERSTDSKLVREALLLLGRFEDAESVPRLIERLDDEDQALRSAAHWSLKHLSGLSLRAEPRRWNMWHKTEAEWWQVHAPEVLGWLRSFNIKDRKRAIAIISQRRMRKHLLAKELLPLLSDTDESIVALAVRALSILEARSTAPQVRELLEHHSEAVRASATAALALW